MLRRSAFLDGGRSIRRTVDSTEAATTPNDDSARILAASGWQSDPRRLPVLRGLLREHVRRIYLYSYEESRNRAAAIDRTRRTLLQVARTVQSIPAGCPFLTWTFLALEEGRVYPQENPDFWRLLVIAEEERKADAGRAAADERSAGGDVPAATLPASVGTEGSGARTSDAPTGTPGTADTAGATGATGATGTGGTSRPAGTASHPTLRPLVSLYRRFLDTPGAEGIEPRANWPAAEADLECFLRAQFAETGDATGSTASAWRRWFVTRPWRRPRNIAAAAVIVVIVAIGLVLAFTLLPQKGQGAGPLGSSQIWAAEAPGAEGQGGDVEPGGPQDHASTATQRWALGTAVPERAPVTRTPTGNRLALSNSDQVASAGATSGLAVSGRSSMRIADARCVLNTRDSLRFTWTPTPGVTEYRLCLITPERDTLGVVSAITGTRVTIPVDGVPGMRVPGSFIFRVDGLSGGRLLAISDPQPFDVP